MDQGGIERTLAIALPGNASNQIAVLANAAALCAYATVVCAKSELSPRNLPGDDETR
jgi:hypothetical protein